MGTGLLPHTSSGILPALESCSHCRGIRHIQIFHTHGFECWSNSACGLLCMDLHLLSWHRLSALVSVVAKQHLEHRGEVEWLAHNFRMRLHLLLERLCITLGFKALDTLNRDVTRKSSSALEHIFNAIKWSVWFEFSTKPARVLSSDSST